MAQKPQPGSELEVLLRIERKMSALLSIAIDQHLRASEELAKPRPRSIDRILADAGLLGTEIAAALGKTPQAVSQVLKGDGKGASRDGVTRKLPSSSRQDPIE